MGRQASPAGTEAAVASHDHGNTEAISPGSQLPSKLPPLLDGSDPPASTAVPCTCLGLREREREAGGRETRAFLGNSGAHGFHVTTSTSRDK